jgi:2-dehydrotetronate isomerase
MPQFSANLSMMYQEVEFLDRFGLAAADGFEYVEFLFPYTFPSQAIVDQLTNHGLKLQLFNAPPGDFQAGERGIAILADRQKEFEDGIALAIEYAQAMDCPNLHVMAGIKPEGVSFEDLYSLYLKRIEFAAHACESFNIDVVIEPINTTSMPGYFLNYQSDAIRVIQDLLLPNVKLMMDFFHAQIMEGNLEYHLTKNLPHIGHVQIAGVPHRHEPDHGEVNYHYLLDLLDALEYEGIVGCEYKPMKGTSEGLKWLDSYR